MVKLLPFKEKNEDRYLGVLLMRYVIHLNQSGTNKEGMSVVRANGRVEVYPSKFTRNLHIPVNTLREVHPTIQRWKKSGWKFRGVTLTWR